MSLRRSVSALCAFGLLSFAIPSFADTLPPAAQDCKGNPQPGGTADLGEDCSLNDSADTQGTCQTSTCSVTGLCTDGGNGACSHEIACVLCIAGNGDGGKQSAGEGDGGAVLASSNGASGCNTTPANESSGSASLLVGLAMLAGVIIRLRKKS